MRMKKRYKREVTREYRVYNEDGLLIMRAKKGKEIMKKFNMPCPTYIYNFKNTGVYFKPFNKADYKIKIDFVREVKESDAFEIPEDSRDVIVDFPGEIWKEVPGEPFNYCSNLGRVKYVDEFGNEKLAYLFRSRNANGRYYLDATLINPDPEGKSKRCRVHRIVARTFLDKDFPLNSTRGADIVVNHKDNDSENNALDNIEICTRKENAQAALAMGVQFGHDRRKCYAERNGIRKEYESTADLVKDITGKSNNGYFNAAVTNGNKLYGWTVGYID